MRQSRAVVFVLVVATALTVRWGHAQATTPKLAANYTEIPSTVIDPNWVTRGVRSLENADLNGDGYQDLVILGIDPASGGTCCTPQPGRVYLGDGDGHFTRASAALFPVDTLNTVQTANVLFADFNGDLRVDMFLNNEGWDTDPYVGEQNRLYLSLPDGGWRDATATLPQLVDMGIAGAVGDLSGKGTSDIFIANGGSGLSRVAPYTLLNDRKGLFTLSRANVPVGDNQILNPFANAGASLQGATLADLSGDGLPELIVGGRAKSNLPTGTIFWNHGGLFLQTDTTSLPDPGIFPSTRWDIDVQRIDIDQDGLPDLVLAGTQGDYTGWYVQVLLNRGGRTFVDETAQRLPMGQFSGDGSAGHISPWSVKVLDFNRDGAPDFFVQFLSGPFGKLPASWPILWINDGTGHFSTLKVGDFVASGREFVLGSPYLVATRYGYSFFNTQYSGNVLRITGMLATKRKLPGIGR
jgi:hypothetical protein